MFIDHQAKDCTRYLSLHIELIMWGDDFLEIEASNPAEPKAKWLSLCDGGSIENEGNKSISKDTFDRIIDYIYSVNFPDHEDDEMNLRWEILCLDTNENNVAGINFGYWNRDVLIEIVQHLQEILNDEAPFTSIIRAIEA